MNLSNYEEFINYLYTYEDLKYKNFHKKLIKNDVNLIGIRVPILKEIAKKIAKDDYKKIFSILKFKYYEEVMIYGLVIGYLKVPFNDVLNNLDEFLIYNDNWAVNDSVSANLKIFKKNLDEGLLYIKKIIKTGKTYYIRFGLTLLLNFYKEEKYLEEIFKIIKEVNNHDYYVDMAISWLLSFCYINYKDKTYNYLNNTKLNNFILRKTISKINDSYRVSEIDKIKIKKLLEGVNL